MIDTLSINRMLLRQGVDSAINSEGELIICPVGGEIVIDNDNIYAWSGLGCECDYAYKVKIKSNEHAVEVVMLMVGAENR